MDLSIVIASYNTCEITCRCLEAVFRATRDLKKEVIVVDNASRDQTCAMIVRKFPEALLIRNDRNVGFAAAQNIGLKRSSGRYLMILNSDVFLEEDMPRRMLEHFGRVDGRIGVLGPQILNPDGSVAPSARRFFLGRPMILLGVINRYFNFKRFLPEQFMRRNLGFLLGRWHDNYAAHDGIREVDFVDGMCFLVRRETLEEAGLFDEQFFFDEEILDLSLRIRKSGWRIEYFPPARAMHVGHASRKLFSPIVVETQRSEFIFCSRHVPHLLPFVRGAVIAVVGLKRSLLFPALLFGDRSGEKRRMLDIYGQILSLARAVDAEAFRRGAVIPRLSRPEH